MSSKSHGRNCRSGLALEALINDFGVPPALITTEIEAGNATVTDGCDLQKRVDPPAVNRSTVKTGRKPHWHEAPPCSKDRDQPIVRQGRSVPFGGAIDQFLASSGTGRRGFD